MRQRLRDLEARDNWIAARVEGLMDDADLVLATKEKWFYCEDDVIYSLIKTEATEQAIREHASIIADLEEAIIDSMELK